MLNLYGEISIRDERWPWYALRGRGRAGCVRKQLVAQPDPGNQQYALVQGDDVLVAGVRARQPQRQVVGLGARVDEEADRQRLRHEVGEALRAQHQVVVQEAVVGVEHRELAGGGRHHVGLAVADWGKREDLVETNIRNCVYQLFKFTKILENSSTIQKLIK